MLGADESPQHSRSGVPHVRGSDGGKVAGPMLDPQGLPGLLQPHWGDTDSVPPYQFHTLEAAWVTSAQ